MRARAGRQPSPRALAAMRGACGMGCWRRELTTCDVDAGSPFDLAVALPAGVTVLEASAGTGKTFTIAALAARYIAEGSGLARSSCSSPSRGWPPASCANACASASSATEQRATRGAGGRRRPGRRRDRRRCSRAGRAPTSERRSRLWRARSPTSTRPRSRPPTASARRCWTSSARSATSSPTSTFAENVDDLIEEVIDDLYVRRFYRQGGAPFDRAEAGRIARMAIDNPTAHRPSAARPARRAAAAMRHRLALAARKELERRKRELAMHDLRRPADASTATRSGAPAAAPRRRACGRATGWS